MLTYRIKCFISFLFLTNLVECSEISIATCNLWNVMFNWETRIRRIAEMIREHDLDVVVFQEVRMNSEGYDDEAQYMSSQLNEFRLLLPEYRWILASSAGTVAKFKNSYKMEWNLEGLGVISRRQIIFSDVVKLKKTSFKDRNKRIALHLRLQLGVEEEDFVDAIVVHFSYDPQQQCQNANDVIEIIDDSNLKKVIVLGDFNAYESVTPPVNLFLKRENSACPILNSPVIGTFKDVWLETGKSHMDGLTFSNMPFPGLQSRPDRILVSKSIQVLKVDVIGDGRRFQQKYYISLLLNRANAIIKTSFQSFNSYQGYSCLQDCGPHGSCRCGVCVTGGDANNCYVPHCSECTGYKFILFLSFLIPTFIACVMFLLAVIRLLIISGRFSQKDIQEILGYRCCLFNRQLFHMKIFPSRRFRVSLSNCLQLYHLPPVWVILGISAFLIILYSVFKFCFKDTIDLIYFILPEEQFPSDHKIVCTKLKV